MTTNISKDKKDFDAIDMFNAEDHDWENDCLTYKKDGILMSKWMCDDVINAIMEFEVRDDDIWVITYPKAGTTWMQVIMSLVSVGGDENELTKSYMENVPFIEFTRVPHYSLIDKVPQSDLHYNILAAAPSPRMIKTHLQNVHLPRQLFEKKAKIIYVARNPKDVAVSFFYFHIHNPTLTKYPEWNAFYEDYKKDQVIYGSWFDHNLFWWKRRHLPNVLFLKYNEMKRDLKGTVIKVSDFMGYKLSDDAIDKIVHLSDFKNMKGNNKIFGKLPDSSLNDLKQKFFRKGTTGDWKNHFTVAQNEEYNKIIEEKLKGTGLTFNDE